MSQYEMMKLFEQFDGEISESDFTPEEMEEYLRYFEEAEKSGATGERPLSPSEWKRKYFTYYDDIKDKSLKKQDW